MASEGLSRRRVANASSSNSPDDDDHRQPSSSHSSTPTPALAAHHPHSHGGSAFEGGSKVAYDPRDLEANDEEEKIGGIIPRLTIMEEVLLLGLKDRQVSTQFDPGLYSWLISDSLGIPFVLERQHLVCTSWLYPPRARFPPSNCHRTRPQPIKNPVVRTPRRGHRRAHDRRDYPR